MLPKIIPRDPMYFLMQNENLHLERKRRHYQGMKNERKKKKKKHYAYMAIASSIPLPSIDVLMLAVNKLNRIINEGSHQLIQ